MLGRMPASRSTAVPNIMIVVTLDVDLSDIQQRVVILKNLKLAQL
jgi:hypothetical protein